MGLVFHVGEVSGKGQHSPIPSKPRLRVRPSSDVDASAGAVKTLQKLGFWRRATDIPDMVVQQGEKERIRNRAPEWLTDDADIY